MVPTHYKAKLPKHLSYPVGAEAISTALAGAAHLESLSVSFHSRPVEPASRFHRMLSDRLPYTVVLAEYHPARKPGLSAAAHMIESGWYDERWRLTIYPVLSELRQAANMLLRERGFPALSVWLHEAEKAARGMTTQRIELVFDPGQESLEAIESSQHQRSRV